MRIPAQAFGLIAAVLLCGQAAAEDGNWVGTWTASAQPAWAADFAVGLGMPDNFWNQTIRQRARVSIGGSRARIEVSNEYGEFPITISAGHLALAREGSAIIEDTDRVLTFSGEPEITVPAGAVVLSDPVDLEVSDLADVSVSLHFADVAPTSTIHWDGHDTAYIASGDQTGSASFPDDAATMTKRAFLTEIMVDAPEGTIAIITFGDSITDGDGSTVDGNDRWPNILAERLVEAGMNVAVQNQGISGAKVLSDRMGTNALARFERDVLSQDDATAVVVMMGINDIGWPGTALAPNDPPADVAAIIAGYKQLIARAHANGLKIYGATLTPFADSFAGTAFEGYYSDAKEAKRKEVNAFIRSGAFDGVIDFAAAVEDPDKPDHIRRKFDKGDHLHPNAAGYASMAASIDLGMLAR
jgi:lysophospholipase L1-like esterase